MAMGMIEPPALNQDSAGRGRAHATHDVERTGTQSLAPDLGLASVAQTASQPPRIGLAAHWRPTYTKARCLAPDEMQRLPSRLAKLFMRFRLFPSAANGGDAHLISCHANPRIAIRDRPTRPSFLWDLLRQTSRRDCWWRNAEDGPPANHVPVN